MRDRQYMSEGLRVTAGWRTLNADGHDDSHSVGSTSHDRGQIDQTSERDRRIWPVHGPRCRPRRYPRCNSASSARGSPARLPRYLPTLTRRRGLLLDGVTPLTAIATERPGRGTNHRRSRMTIMSPKARFAFHQRRAHDIERRLRFERLAHHEAAHAAASIHFGRAVGGLRLGFDDNGGESGQCWSDDLDSLPAFSQLVLLAAGGAAERKLTGNDAVFDGDDQALSRTIVLAEFRDVRDSVAELERASCAAERIVADNWAAIAALARALIDAGGQMTREQADRYLANIARAAPSMRAHSPTPRLPALMRAGRARPNNLGARRSPYPQ
jgi:hypothetical protein